MSPDLDGATLRRMIPPAWWASIEPEVGPGALDRLAAALNREVEPVVPARDRWFRALEVTPLASVRAVILGQDPYPDPALAEGLAFSVPNGVKRPLSLRRILAEAGVTSDENSLLPWAERGVLLLNAALTVRQGSPGRHLAIWRDVTDAILRAVAAQQRPIVFFAWGAKAQASMRRAGISEQEGYLMCSTCHPAQRRGDFIESRPFHKAESLLRDREVPPIDWSLG